MSIVCLRGINHGIGSKVNFYCRFTRKTYIGDNCHFNGMKIAGGGIVKIGNNFHSGKHIKILTSFHNWNNGNALPYDDTFITKNVRFK